MSEFVIFAIGIVVFALTVYGAVMAGGLAMTRSELDQNARLARRAGQPKGSGLPTDVDY